MEIYNLVIDSFIKVRDEHYIKSIGLFTNIIDTFIPISDFEKEQIKKKSIYFNVFDFFKINEPLHSKLLGTLLNPYSNHGQGRLFLNEFLKIIGIEYFDEDVWQVTAEIGRIDILIKCLNRPSVIIIENKSNGAIDQNNQIYRYWYQEILLPYGKEALNIKRNFRIIYLAPTDSKSFEAHTLEKPKEYSDNLDDRINSEKILKLTFKNEIVSWLNNCYEQLPESNFRIKEYVKQYRELWEMKF